MNTISEVSYDVIVCPNCHKEQESIPEHEIDEFFVKCECNTLFRVIEIETIKYTSSLIKE